MISWRSPKLAQGVAVDGRVVERAHRLRRVAQVGERLEQRRRAAAARPRARREPQRGEHVRRPLDHRDAPSRARRACRTPRARARPCRARAAARRPGPRGGGSSPRRPWLIASSSSAQPLVLVRVAVAGQQRRDRLLHDRGRLAHVERGDVEAEHVDLPQQPPDRAVRRRAPSRRCRARARGRRAAPAGRCSRARARADRACSSSRCVMKPSFVRSGSYVAVRAAQHARRGQLRRRRAPATPRARGRPACGATECEKACASRSTRARSSRSAVCAVQRERARERLGARPRGGRPCPSPPTSRTPARARRRGPRSMRSSSSSTSGTASSSVASKKNRLRRTSSSTIGRTRRTSSVCHQQRQRLAQLGEQRAAARAADARVVERVEQRARCGAGGRARSGASPRSGAR